MRMRSQFKWLWLGSLGAGIVLLSVAERSPQVGATAHGRSHDRTMEHATSVVKPVQQEDGSLALVDVDGRVVPLKDYKRIASVSTVSDELLLALCEPERIVAMTEYGRKNLPDGFRYGARPSVQRELAVETLRTLHVDLLITHHLGAPAELEHVREAGIEVFNLGQMRGLSTLLPNIHTVATLLGDPARGERLARRLQRRLRSVAADIHPERRKTAVYVSAYAGQLLGGAAGTSYHDVLTAAGLNAVAATRYRDFMHYDPEQLISLDPDILVTTDTSEAQLCRIYGLGQLRACKTPGGVVAIDAAVIGNPGLGMLDAAEELQERVYGDTGT